MKNLLARRDRLLRRTARFLGLSFTTVSVLCILVPGAIPPSGYFAVLPLFIILAVFQSLAGAHAFLGWQLGTVAAGLALITIIGQISETVPTTAAITAIESLAAASIASVAIVLTVSRRRVGLLSGLFFFSLATTAAISREWDNSIHTVGLVMLGWTLSSIVGIWILAGVPGAHHRITSIGLAHQAQRTASEVEARRSHNARLLHDTVLSTLTLLAHSGVGVSPAALRRQALEDAKLLRQLRLGDSPVPHSSGEYSLDSTQESALGTTLSAVKQKFGRIGLVINWHGCGEIDVRPAVRDAFLWALGECLENVRRHSGVTEASVTIIDDEKTLRAMVTDAGIGFVLAEVDSARLGFSESVVRRLHDVGGQARVFSALGAGTTVVLEVPR